MSFDLNSLPEPPTLSQAISVEISYGAKPLTIGCIALAIHQIIQPPKFLNIACLYATVIQAKKEELVFSTISYLVPLQYISRLWMGYPERGAKFERPTMKMIIVPDKPPAENRLTEVAIRNTLAEFGVSNIHAVP